MIAVNEEDDVIRLSVGDLLGPSRGSDEELAWFTGLHRARMGQDLHSVYLERRSESPGFSKEVRVAHTLNWNGYKVSIEGRVDGIQQSDRGLIVEEVKSTLHSGAMLRRMRPNGRHLDQCLFYCLLLHWKGELVRGGRLVYISLLDSGERLFDIEWDPILAEQRLFARLDILIRAHVEHRRLASARLAFSSAMTFPFDAIRESQDIMIQDVAGAAESGLTLMCSAPTGTGKTIAALFPVIKQALATNSRVFFVTAKVSQQELALETIRLIFGEDAPACAVQITAKERSCPADDEACLDRKCSRLDNFYLRLNDSGCLPRLVEKKVIDSALIHEAAGRWNLCPFELSLTAAEYATVVVSDFNYVFGPGVALKKFFDDPPQGMMIIIDEAHNLPARAQDYFSPEIDIDATRKVASRSLQMNIDVFRRAGAQLKRFCDHFDSRMSVYQEEQGPSEFYVEQPDRTYFENLHMHLEAIIQDYYLYLATERERPDEFAAVIDADRKRLVDPLLNTLYPLRSFCACCEQDPGLSSVIWYKDQRLKMLCMDAAPFIRESLQVFHSSILMSATLTPFSFFSRMLGVDHTGTLMLDLPSPYPKENRCFMLCPAVNTTFRKRGASAPMIARMLIETIACRQGNYLAFFPSFAYRDEVLEFMRDAPFQIIRQEPAMKTDRVLEDLEANHDQTILLCAVHGGVFSEGVDFAGHMAIGAFIIGPGLPALTVEQELIRSYYEQNMGEGFDYAYVYPGMNRVVQAGGRVIRSATDKGFVAMFGERFLLPQYRDKLPEYWRDEMIETSDPAEQAARFWEGLSSDASQ
jgi:DNA excision repair protein ERCC-2